MEYFSDPHVIGWNGYSGGYSNPELNDLLILARTTGDIDQRIEYVHDIQEIIAEDLPALNLRNHVALTVYRTDKYDNWQLGEDLLSIYNILQLEPAGPEEIIVTETVTETVTEQVEVEKTPSWVYALVGVLVIAVGALGYMYTQKK